MAGTIPELTSLPTSDRTTNLLEVCDVNGNVSYKATPNFLLGITGAPIGTTDSQTLTNKTLTAPTISSPSLSGTLTGTYVIGGTPTFPSSVVTLTGTQTLTNKTLASPTITSPTITNASITADAITGFTTANTGTIFGVTVSAGAFSNPNVLPPGTVVQQVSTSYSAMATGTTLIPHDDTIPQITEGTEFMTQAITPKATTNTLIVDALMYISYGVAAYAIQAIFQDSGVNALAASEMYIDAATGSVTLHTRLIMAAGTISPTTFRARAGGHIAGTITFNGTGGARIFGTINKSSITITEYKV